MTALRFGVTGGNIIGGGGAGWVTETWPGVRGLFVWIRHKLAKGHRPDTFEAVGTTRFARCEICGQVQVFEPGSGGYDFIMSLERFKAFTDTEGEPLFTLKELERAEEAVEGREGWVQFSIGERKRRAYPEDAEIDVKLAGEVSGGEPLWVTTKEGREWLERWAQGFLDAGEEE